METPISPNQSTFIKGCVLVYVVVAIIEVVDLPKWSKKLIFKVDFEKAYDFVSWSFLD